MGVPSHKHTRYEEQFIELTHRITKLERQLSKERRSELRVYSAGNDVCIGMYDDMWHRIVCEYEGNVCLGTPRKHWMSTWSFNERGFSVERFVDETYKGWEGHYSEDSTLRFVELPKDVVNLHTKAIQDFIKTKCHTWLPGCLYNDVSGDLYCP